MLVSVPPEGLPSLECAATAGGEIRALVATLEDANPFLEAAGGPAERFALPSSGPEPCDSTIVFGRVVADHRYTAEVDAYARADVTPAAVGSRVMLDPESREIVAPVRRWTCDSEVVAAENWTVPVQGCRVVTD
jgi:hypothetical protein